MSRLRREITRTLYLVDRSYEQLFAWRRLGITRRDLVLDIGSGGHPFIRADVLCDKFLFDNTERQRKESLVLDRPVVVGDASRLPFRDHAFDFARSSHLLEHLDDPEGHLRELQRVSRRGIIITPSEAWERIFPIGTHRWVVNQRGPSLVLREKPAPVFDEYVADVFHTKLDRYGFSFFWNYFRNVFEVHYCWDGAIAFDVERLPDSRALSRVTGSTHKDDADQLDAAESGTKRKLKRIASRIVRRFGSDHYRLDLWSIVACPACHGPLVRKDDVARCERCARDYQVRGEIPILLMS